MIKAILVKNSEGAEEVISEAAKESGMIEIIQELKIAELNFKNLKNLNCDLLIIDSAASVTTESKLMKSAKKILSKPFIIVISAHQPLATQAFDCGIDDFIIGPAKKHRLLLSFRRIRERYMYRLGRHDGAQKRYFFVREKNALRKINPDDIVYIQAMGDYILIHTAQKKYTIHSTIKNMEARLPRNQFARVHRSHLVNLEKVERIADDIIFINSHELPIGEAYRSEVLQHLSILK